MKTLLPRPPRSSAGLALAFVAATGAFAPGCSSKTETLCSTVCDCQHCNDFTREETCDQLSAGTNVANDYGCSSQYSAVVQCNLDHGTCVGAQSRYTTQQLGTCSANGRCNGNLAFPCTTDADCPGGTDLCASQKQALMTCVTAASKDPTVANGLGIFQMQPVPGTP
jgi:hypothetical protein